MIEPVAATVKQVRCPQCGKMSAYHGGNAYRPFCGKRCKLIDLGAWANDAYVIAGPPLAGMAAKEGGGVPPLPPDGDHTL